MDYDFIVVGAGSAGMRRGEAVSRRRTSSRAPAEAGPSDRRIWVQSRSATARPSMIAASTDVRHEPIPVREPRQLLAARKDPGRSSSINAMVYIAVRPGNFDEWESLGNRGWAGRTSSLTTEGSRTTPWERASTMAQQGPLHVTDSRATAHPLCHVFIRCRRGNGPTVQPRLQRQVSGGCGLYQITTRQRFPLVIRAAFLWPAMRRPNLR